MNLRKEKPEKKKRGRPEEKYTLTFKGYLYAALSDTNVGIEGFYKNLVEFAKGRIKKDNEVAAIVFDSEGGSFSGVTRRED